MLFGFLLFGPDKLPQIAKTVGRALTKFRSAQEEVTKVVKNEIYDPKSDTPFKDPIEALEQIGKKSENKTVAKQESFAERKARYDRERAARREADKERYASVKTTQAGANEAKDAQADYASAEKATAAEISQSGAGAPESSKQNTNGVKGE